MDFINIFLCCIFGMLALGTVLWFIALAGDIIFGLLYTVMFGAFLCAIIQGMVWLGTAFSKVVIP